MSPREWAIAVAALPAVSALVAIYTAGRLAWRTMALTKRLLEYELDRLPQRLTALAAELGLGGRVRVVESPHFHAFSFGWLKPEVVVSTGAIEALSEEELRALLLHEACHVRRRDPLRALLWSATATGLFWLPLLCQWSQFRALQRELKADMAAIRALGSSRPLAGALLKALQQAEGQEQTALAAFSATAARIEQLLDPGGASAPFRPGRLGWVQSLVSLLVLAALVCLLLAGGMFGSVGEACHGC
jgi:Zn-dependent protease with chaperone function